MLSACLLLALCSFCTAQQTSLKRQHHTAATKLCGAAADTSLDHCYCDMVQGKPGHPVKEHMAHGACGQTNTCSSCRPAECSMQAAVLYAAWSDLAAPASATPRKNRCTTSPVLFLMAAAAVATMPHAMVIPPYHQRAPNRIVAHVEGTWATPYPR